MIIKQKRYNQPGKRKEESFDDKEFHSLQEIKDYCIKEANHNLLSLYDGILYTFVIMDTNEELEISAQWYKDDDDSYYIKLDYWF